MRIQTTGYVVWDKKKQEVQKRGNMFVYYRKSSAWLAAWKERKQYGKKVVKVKITVES